MPQSSGIFVCVGPDLAGQSALWIAQTEDATAGAQKQHGRQCFLDRPVFVSDFVKRLNS